MTRIFAIVLLASLAPWGIAADSTAADRTELVTGQLLVATDRMPDPRFAETVIYMVQHGPEGAMGVVLNRPIDTFPLDDLLREFGEEAGPTDTDVRVLAGGPVYPDRGYVLHTNDYTVERTLVVDGDFAFTAGIQPLRDLAGGEGPAEAMLFIGISSWGPGQLEGEMTTGSWALVPADLGIVFDDDVETKWERALARQGVDL